MRPMLDLVSSLFPALAACLLLASPGAMASPAVIGAGQAMRFEVDMRGLAPSPPYSELRFAMGLDIGNSVGGESHVAFFTEPGGQGNSLVDPFTSISDLVSFTLTDPGFLDGLFSVEVWVVDGQVAFDPQVLGLVQTPRGVLQTEPLSLVGEVITAPQNNVPEPAGLALALLGLLSLGAARGLPRRKAWAPAAA